MMKFKSAIAALVISGALFTSAAPAQVGQAGPGQVMGNATAAQARAQPSNITAILDRALGSARGSILERGSSGWITVGPGSTAGLPWVSNGTGADPAYQLLGAVGGGTGNGFFQVSGPAGSIKNYTFPNASSTMGALNAVQTWTSAQSFTDGDLLLLGSSSGSVILHAPATGGASATFFGGTDIVTGLAAVQTLTNKTINCASNTCTVRLASDVTGQLPTANGGTGVNAPANNAIYKGQGTSPMAASALSDNGTVVSSSESIDTTSNAHVQEIANAGTTGTTVNKLAKLTGSPATAVIATTSDTTGNVIGIVTGGAGTTGNAQIAVAGQASCVFDGAITSGHYAQVSTTAGGSCHDGGATFPTSGQILGLIVAATNATPGSTPQAVTLFAPGTVGTSASSAGTVTSVTCGTGLSGGTITTSGTCALSLNGAIVSTQPTNPSGTASATFVMMGLGVSTCRITPTYSTRIEFEIYGDITNSTAATVTIRYAFGTGTGPANGAAATGTISGSSLAPSLASISDVKPFKIGSIVQSLTAGTTYWFDLEIETSAGTANALALTCSAKEVL